MSNFKIIYFLFLMSAGFVSISNAQTPDSPTIPLSNDLQDETVLDFTENPCPDPKRALSETPNDLKIIQEDITRFNLCLQRAQLLSRLNDLAAENLETINSTMDEKIQAMVGSIEPVVMPMPQPPIPDMPQIDDMTQTGASSEPLPMTPVEPVAPIIEYESEFWSINEIKGIGGVLVATIEDSDGNIARVKNGDTIPDTEVKIVNVTQTNVHVRDNKEAIKLKWNQ